MSSGQLSVHFAGLRLLGESPQGQVYGGTDINGTEVTIAVLGEALAVQPSVRNAFVDVVWRHSVGSEPGRVTVYAADLHAGRPWAAVRGEAGRPGAEQLFDSLTDAAPTAAVPIALVPPPPPPLPSAAVLAAPPPAASRRGQGPWALGAVCAVLLVGLMAVATIVAVRVLRDDEPVGSPTGVPVPPTDSTGSPDPTVSPGTGGQPSLRDVEPVSLVGPTFAPQEDTYTMAFNGWPFAFRAPNDWSCANGVTSSSRIEGEVKSCFSLAVEGGVVLWECRADCDEAEQEEKLDIWFADEPGEPVPWGDGPPTHYVETEENDEGRYAINLARFFGTGSDELRWLVGVTFESTPEGVEGMQKVVNDILSQTS
jgi:hypothetical protein